MAVFSLVFLFISLIGFLAFRFLLPPRNFPKQIPTVPFLTTLLPLFKKIDQIEIYRKYLEQPLAENGALKIFFGARWNILVTRPEYVAEIFKNEDTFAKSGNQEKIPYSVLGQYTGDNIISSHGENWQLYRSIIKPELQREYDIEPIARRARDLVNLIRSEQKLSPQGGIIMQPLLQRFTLATLSESVMNTNPQTLEKPDAPLNVLQSAVKRAVSKPIFLSFPILDCLPFASRKEARKLVRRLTDELCSYARTSKGSQLAANQTRSLARSLAAARDEGRLSQKQFEHNMVTIVLAGHENPQQHFASLMYLLGKNSELQEQLREEISALDEDEGVALQQASELVLFTSVLYESLRLLPPISQLINRKTTTDVVLGGKIPIPAGTYVGYSGYATHRDKNSWGEDADEFRPGRWGSSKAEVNTRYRQAVSRGEFIAFHGGRRACLGQKFALLQARVTLIRLLKSLRWKIDPMWEERMTPAGPLFPVQLQLIFEDV